MNSKSLLDYIKNEKILDPDVYDNLRYELDKHVYYFGDHFKHPNEKVKVQRQREILSGLLKNLYFRYRALTKNRPAGKPSVVSNAYFNFNDKLKQQGYHVTTPSWGVKKSSRDILGDISLYSATDSIRKELLKRNFDYLVSEDFILVLKTFKKQLKDTYVSEGINALFIPNDESFFENLSINIFKELVKPSFIFLHGLPARYNIIDENRSDYLLVWGDKIKQHYISHGFNGNKIIVTGHPYYELVTKNEFRFGLSNILVLAKAATGSPHSVGMTLYDRGNLIVYLLSIQKVLKKLKVNKVKLRLHPSANPEWHYKFLDRNFFILDNEPLSESLKSSSLVIGPTSSVFLEALAYGVNYLTFEPSNGVNGTLLNEPLVPPFDGSDSGVPVAYTQEELLAFIERKCQVNPDVFNEYIQPTFDISFLKELIDNK